MSRKRTACRSLTELDAELDSLPDETLDEFTKSELASDAAYAALNHACQAGEIIEDVSYDVHYETGPDRTQTEIAPDSQNPINARPRELHSHRPTAEV